ncbi:MAG: C40 family peptidase [Clostridiaceae bacterium]|jgi:cell wall-associated NlpC family hydrolase|nr:C40 family peptidase [Clostridiaceae bacterium]
MERPRKINFPFLMLTLLFLLSQTAFVLSSTLFYDETNGNVQGNQTKEEIYLSIETVKTNALDYLIAEKAAADVTLSSLQEMDTTIQNIAPTDDSIVTSTDLNPDETDMAVALMANDEVPEPVEPTPTPKPEIKSVVKHVNANKLNVREEPTSQSKLVTSITRGDKVTYFETVGEWARIITWTDRKGYVLAKYLVDSADKVEKVVVQAPKPQETKQPEEIVVASRGTEENPQEEASVSPEAEKLADEIVDYAKTWLGVPYRWAGNSKNGTDCSGLTYHVFKHFGIDVPRSSRAYSGIGTKVSRSEIKKGDILMWDTDRNGTIGHVGIYIGDGMFIHASSSKGKVVTRSLSSYSEKYMGARRVIK